VQVNFLLISVAISSSCPV